MRNIAGGARRPDRIHVDHLAEIDTKNFSLDDIAERIQAYNEKEAKTRDKKPKLRRLIENEQNIDYLVEYCKSLETRPGLRPLNDKKQIKAAKGTLAKITAKYAPAKRAKKSGRTPAQEEAQPHTVRRGTRTTGK